MTTTESTETVQTTIPCGWCDSDVQVSDDHGQVVYCGDLHARLDGYLGEDVDR